MDANSPLTPQDQKKADNRRKRKAILAGGVVLGLGAAVTLAAWSDDVFANGTFQTGTFELEGTADGTTWAEYDDAPGAALYFNTTASSSTNASPLQYNETVWAPLSVRLTAATGVDGTYVLTGVTFPTPDQTLLAEDSVLDYVVLSGVDRATCAAAADGTTPVGTSWYAGTVDVAPTAATPASLVANAVGTAGTPDNLCLGITLTSNDQVYMGQDATQVQWQFTATQNDS